MPGSLAREGAAVKAVMGLRVSADEELEGLDIGEHGNLAYPDFVLHADGFGGGGMMPAGPAGGAPRKSYATEAAHA